MLILSKYIIFELYAVFYPRGPTLVPRVHLSPNFFGDIALPQATYRAISYWPPQILDTKCDPATTKMTLWPIVFAKRCVLGIFTYVRLKKFDTSKICVTLLDFQFQETAFSYFDIFCLIWFILAYFSLFWPTCDHTPRPSCENCTVYLRVATIAWYGYVLLLLRESSPEWFVASVVSPPPPPPPERFFLLWESPPSPLPPPRLNFSGGIRLFFYTSYY